MGSIFKTETKIKPMLQQGFICPVTVPTNWCSGIVHVPNPCESGRIELVQRQIHHLPAVAESFAKLARGKIFSKVRAISGFLKVPLHEESKLLTFITLFGHFRGVFCQAHVLIHGVNKKDHSEHVSATQVQDALEDILI